MIRARGCKMHAALVAEDMVEGAPVGDGPEEAVAEDMVGGAEKAMKSGRSCGSSSSRRGR